MGPLMPRNFLSCTFTPSITLGMWAPAAENRALGVATVKVSFCRWTLPQVKVLLRLYGATIKTAVLRLLLSTPPLVRGIFFFFSWLLHLFLSFSTSRLFFILFVPHCAVIKSQNDRWFYLCRPCRNAFRWNPREHTCTRTYCSFQQLTQWRAITSVIH